MTSITPVTMPIEETLHGVRVQDPYRWLEDRSLPETEEWIGSQKSQCDEYFVRCRDLGVIRDRVRSFLDVTTLDQPTRIGESYFFRRRSQGQEQAALFVCNAHTGHERVLVAAPNHPLSSVRIHRISHDSRWMAYERRHGGSDQKEIHIMDAQRGIPLSVNVLADWSRGLAFDAHEPGFFYCWDTSQPNQHTIRRSSFDGGPSDDLCFCVARTPGSRLLLLADQKHIGALHFHLDGAALVLDFWVADQHSPVTWRAVFVNRESSFLPMLLKGRLFALMFEDTPNGRCVEFDWEGREIQTIVPEQSHPIRQIAPVGSTLFVHSFGDMKSSIHRWSLNAEDLGEFALPNGGTVQLLPPLGPSEDSLFYRWESFHQPPMLFEHIPSRGDTHLQHQHSGPRPPKVHVETLSFASSDGVSIPITMATTTRAARDARTPVLMTAYGGFGVPSTPQFSVLVTIMLELGVTFALPHIRGGGEFGKAWHDAGRKTRRQTSISDFVAAGVWLCERNVAAAGDVAIFGGSHAGLLVAAAMTQRPDLFGAVLCMAPLLDMVRYERFDLAARWRDEYGSVDDAEEFHALHAYSPYHHVKEDRNYPATMFVSGDMDDRCNPAHVRKMVARLQERAMQVSPVLMDYSEARGHNPALPMSVRIDALARRIAFLCKELGMTAEFGGLR